MSVTIQTLERFGQSVVAEILVKILEVDAFATGETYDSVSYRTESTRAFDTLIVEGGRAFGVNKRGGTFVEDGRGAGGVPPFERIANWAIARGIIDDVETDKGIVFAIQRKIAEQGTNIHRDNAFRDIAKTIADESNQRFDDLLESLSQDLNFEITSSIYKLTERK